MIELTFDDARDVAYALVAEMKISDEPMPDFDSRYPHRLESVLASPFVTFDSEDLYPTLEEKAAVLFYSCCKDHPFENGNKRMAVVLLETLLFLNGRWLDVSPMKLYELALAVTESEPEGREKVLESITRMLQVATVSVEEASERLGMSEADAA